MIKKGKPCTDFVAVSMALFPHEAACSVLHGNQYIANYSMIIDQIRKARDFVKCTTELITIAICTLISFEYVFF